MLSYVTIEDADQYFQGRDDAAHWFSLTEIQKSSVLEQATRFLDHSFQWKGSPAKVGQPLRWPRQNVFDPDGILLDQNVIPLQIRNAVLEQALFGISSGNLPLKEGIKSISIGKMSLSFERSAERELISPEAARFVRGLGTFCSSGKKAGKSGFFLRG